MTSNDEGGDHSQRNEVSDEGILATLNKVNKLYKQSLALVKENEKT